MGDQLIAWTARAAVGCFLVRLLLLLRRRGAIADWSEIAVWTAGWLLLVTHTACAFQFQHHWSHAAAYSHTARRTAELAGWDWGGGLYFNYLTIVIWGVDLLILIGARRRLAPAPRWWTALAISGIGFIVLNATLVFGPRGWWGIGGVLLLVAVAIQRRPRREAD